MPFFIVGGGKRWFYIMHRGFLKLYRKIEDHWIYDDADALKAWITILLSVNHSPEKVKIGNDIFICGRGEKLYSLDTWSKKFGKRFNKSKTRRLLQLFVNDGMILLKNERKTTRLSVCNYDTYNDTRNTDETQVKRKRNADETQMTPSKECIRMNKNEKENTVNEVYDFYLNNYPKRTTVLPQLKSIIRERLESGVTSQDLIDGCKNYANFVKHKKVEHQYIKRADNFIKQGMYLEEFKIEEDPKTKGRPYRVL